MADVNTLLNSDLESRYEKKRMSGICFAGHYGETRFTRD